jgi:hypothetical protein
MQSTDAPQIDGSWWAVLARRLLHPVQVDVLDALWRSHKVLSARDLSQIIDGAEPVALAHYHLRRLRKLGAIIPVGGGGACRGPLDTPYRLVRKLSDDGR